MAPSSLDMLSAYALPAIPHIDLPPIPQIANPEYYEVVTTHSSLSKGARSSHDLAPKVGLKDYEKLEHVGDALLGAVVAVILHDIFPKIGEGPATMLKGQLVSNAILAQISLRYGLPALLRTDPGAQYIVRNQVKTQASVFEAWVAGVYYTVLDSLSDDEGDSVEGDKEEAKGGAAQSGEEVQTTDAMGVEETEEAETVRDKGKAGRIVRFDENVKVEVIENGSELGGSSSGSASPKDAVGEEQSPGISPVKRTVYTPVEGEHISLPSGSSSVKDDASDSSESANVVGCPFAELLSAQARSGIATPLIDESTSLEPIIEDSPNSPGASPSPASSAVSPAVEEIEDSNIPTIPRTAETLEKAQRNTIRLRWLAMCVLDDWLRPIFTPLASWAMTCLREEQIRIRAARTKAYMDVDALDAKTKGCLAILHSSSQKGDIGVPVFESEQVEDGWKVHCKVVRRDGVEFTAESIRTAKRPAHNIAAYRVIVQLGLVEDVEELAKVKEKIAEAATTAGVPHFAASAGVDESGVGARGEAAKSESASGVNATP